MVKKLVSLIITSICIVGTLSGCGSTGISQNNTKANSKVTEITMWHAMGGVGQQAITKIVGDFNATHKNIHVTEQFQGTYEQSLNKLKSSLKGGQGPDVMQVYDVGTRWMIDSKVIVPAQDMIKEDKYNMSSFEKNILAYYTSNHILYSMPFNTSVPLLYYNKTAFNAAGLNPENPPKNMDEVIADAKKLTQKDSNNKVTLSGINVPVNAWFFEEWLGKEGLPYVNKGNGRNSKATVVDYTNNGGGLSIFNKWKELSNSGVFGTDTSGNDIQSSFLAGKTAMMLGSTGSLGDILKASTGKFDLGTAAFPSINATDIGGVSIGGGSLWMLDKKDEAKKKAAWELIKFMVSPQEQAYWNEQTGNIPVTTKAYNIPSVKNRLKNIPQYQTAIDELHASNPKSQGALLSVFPEVRTILENNLTKTLSGELSPKASIDATGDAANKAIDKYNLTNP